MRPDVPDTVEAKSKSKKSPAKPIKAEKTTSFSAADSLSKLARTVAEIAEETIIAVYKKGNAAAQVFLLLALHAALKSGKIWPPICQPLHNLARLSHFFWVPTCRNVF